MDGKGVFIVTTPDAEGIIGKMAELPGWQRAQELRCLLFGTRERNGHSHEWLYTWLSLHELLSKYFDSVQITRNEDDHGGPGLQANCMKPRKGMTK